MSVENNFQIRNNDKNILREGLAEFAVDIRESEPEKWWGITASHIRRFNRLAREVQTPELQAHLKERVNIALESLRETVDFSSVYTDPIETAKTANDAIMCASMIMAEPFCTKEVDIKYERYSLYELCERFPDHFEQKKGVLNGVEVIFFKLKNPNTGAESVLPCPIDKRFWHKGGGPRYAADVVAGSPQSMKDAEIPVSDLDALTAEAHTEGYNLAISMGVDPNGVEYSSTSNLNIIEYFQGRDTTQNQVLLGADGLYISEHARSAAQTGHVEIIGEITAGRAIYNVDKVIVGDLELIKPRGLFRMIKVVAEEKAISFDYLPVNANFDVSLYILYLAKKFSGKENFSDRMQKVFYLMKQMGQTLPDEVNIYQVLERAHQRYPFFDFDSEIDDEEGLAKWKIGKLVKQADREARWECNLPNDLVLKRQDGDTTPRKFSLDGYEYDPKSGAKMDKWWSAFLERSNKRTAENNEKELKPVEKIFNKSDIYDLMDIVNGVIPDIDVEI
jgi:hypothetical protein